MDASGELELFLVWKGEQAPRPGALAHALAESGSGATGAESMGFSTAGDRWAIVTVPASFLSDVSLPRTLQVDGVEVEVSLTAPGKKNA